MSRKALRTGLLAALLAVGASGCGCGERGMTGLGRRLLSHRLRKWETAQTASFTVHALVPLKAAPGLDECEEFSRHITRVLGGATRVGRANVFLIGDAAAWAEVLQAGGRRKDGVSLQLRRDLFIQVDANRAVTSLRLAHELVHLRLWELYGDKVPIWLDEGLASYVGWKSVATAYGGRGRAPFRTVPAVAPDAIRPVLGLMAVAEYPSDEAESRALYRQWEELIRVIAERIGDPALGDFAAAVAGEGRPWDEFLRDRFGLSEHDLASLDAEVQSRSGQTGKR